jgi:Uma2 family endonuclease
MATTVTYEEWLRMPEVQDATEEVIDGEIRIAPPAKWIHAWTVGNICNALATQPLDAPEFLIATAQFGLVIRKAPLTARVPDLAVLEASTIVEQDGFVHSPPHLIVEVLAPGESLSRKLVDYASIGVPEVWVVSPEDRTVEVLYLEDTHLRTASVLSIGTLTPKLFPAVTVDIAAIWPD